jgi:hypothetical protein
MKSFSVSVPCKSYVKKYFSTLYGDCIPLDHRSDWADTILTKMISGPISKANKQVLKLDFERYDSKLKFSLPMDFYFRMNTDLSEQQIYNINRFLENTFDTDLFMTICAGKFFGVPKVTIIRVFAERHNLEVDEDISLDGLKKAYYRFEKKPTSRNFFLLQMSSSISNLNLRA